ncbi:GumC family protein [Dyadobacter chenhuakuii]|uniref:non-specific protein-tyrosine kinase n=1 Tax=Dyadobacter chenhuakuii TaxID=2909339 RepID=A0ABY4XM57_9BACT|nr:tyrosine-protein kinase [Dyadobacter chenhuakuii]MCF2494201.1 polysaccharide biosynthesis tyrosine autokinase [Dyadobacter chenhuakuii]USJ31328.1 polysaccharide biosynthesis tyrosine autokinase [Dyadobacter chenhuakuii]
MNNQSSEFHQDQIDEQGKKFDLHSYIRGYVRYWFLFPICLALALISAFFFLQITQPVYLAKAKLLIKDDQKGISGSGNDIIEEMAQFGGNKLVENEIEILKSQSLMEQTIRELSLDINYETTDGLKTIDLYKQSPIIIKPELISEFAYENPLVIHVIDNESFSINDETNKYKFGQKFRNPWGLFSIQKGAESTFKDVDVTFKDVKTLTGILLKRLEILKPNQKSTVLELSFEDTSIQRGKDVLNKLLDVYVQSSLNDKNSEASNTLKFIESRLGLITGELGDVEKDVESYKKNQGLTDISAESNLYLQNIKENDAQLNDVNIKISVLESVDNYIKNAGDGSPAPATYMINDPILVSLLTRYNDLQIQREKYAQTTQASNPLLGTINTQIANTRQAIRENVQNLKRGLDVTKSSLEGVNARFSAGLRSIPQKEREYVGIKRQQSIKEGLYLYLLQKREETALGYAATVTDSRLVDAPIASFVPIKPKRLIVWAGATAAGILVPLLLINLLLLLNNTVQNREEVESTTKTSVLGEIGLMKTTKDQPGEDAIIKMTSRSAVAEQFRALRTNLQYLGDGNCRTIMFTSSIGGEGKSFVSINLAASLAYSDKRVLLIGLDLRKPTLHERLLVSNKTGASNCLIGQGTPQDFIQPSGVHPKFDVLTSGPIPPNPSELISNGRLPILLKELREQYDYILIDSPPFGLVTDSSLIEKYVDATLYLVRFNYTLLDHLKRIGDLQRAQRFTNLSIIFNGVKYGGGYGYGYGYGGYGYGYYGDEPESKIQTIETKLRKMITRS